MNAMELDRDRLDWLENHGPTTKPAVPNRGMAIFAAALCIANLLLTLTLR